MATYDFKDVAGNLLANVVDYLFDGFGPDPGLELDSLGMFEAWTSVVGESQNELGGLRMTRLTSVVSAGTTTFPVESTLGWEDSGTVAVDGVKYYYTGKTDTTLTGVTHIAAGSSVNGAIIQHRVYSTVTDLTRAFSAMDLLRRALLVNYAESEELNIIGRNLGVDRLPLFRDDDQFRGVIKAVAYNPRGTILGITLALESLVGAANFQVYEDLMQELCRVYIRIDGDYLTGTTSAGKAYLMGREWDEVYGSQDTLALSATPEAVGSVRLKSLDFLFDFRNDKPSAVDMAPWPGETEINPWTYQGGDSEATAVTVVAGEYCKFVSTAGTVYYRMTDANGARLTDKSKAEVSIVMDIPSTATVGGVNRDQCTLVLEDGARAISWGVLNVDASNYRVGLYDSSGWLGSTVDVAKDAYHDIAVIKNKDVDVELWVNGALITRQSHSAFDASSNHRVEFGILSVAASLEVRYKQLGAEWSTVTDYWAARGAAGSVSTSNPTRFTDGASLMVAGDVGKGLIVSGGTVSDGINNGYYVVDSYVSSGVVEVNGPQKTGADITDVDATKARIEVDDQDAFVYPDDIGKDIVISGSALGNDGTYVITKLFVPGTGPSSPVNLADFKSVDASGKPVQTRTNYCEVATELESEVDLDYRLDPNFETESSLDWELSDASSFSGSTITLRQGLWVNGLVLEMWASNVKSAQLLADTDEANVVIDTGPPVLYEFYPFYLADPLGLIQGYLDDLTAAGVIPEYETY